MRPELSARYQFLLGGILGVLYGLITRLAFGHQMFQDIFDVMSTSFIFFVPVALGFISVFFGSNLKQFPGGRIFLAPLAPAIVYLVSALILAWEGLICIIIWLPIVVTMSLIGGIIAGVVQILIKSSSVKTSIFAFILALPYLMAPLERHNEAPSDFRLVTTEIQIESDVQTIWNNIERVQRISDAEHQFSLSQLIGFPKPIEANLIGEGAGAIRHATFEGGVLFIETITHWVPNEYLSFSIKADTDGIPSITLDEHVTVGGAFFDVLQGTYTIEPITANRHILHLSSNYRLSTNFNLYSHLWTDFFMSDIQNSILKIIKKRCENTTARPNRSLKPTEPRVDVSSPRSQNGRK